MGRVNGDVTVRCPNVSLRVFQGRSREVPQRARRVSLKFRYPAGWHAEVVICGRIGVVRFDIQIREGAIWVGYGVRVEPIRVSVCLHWAADVRVNDAGPASLLPVTQNRLTGSLYDNNRGKQKCKTCSHFDALSRRQFTHLRPNDRRVCPFTVKWRAAPPDDLRPSGRPPPAVHGLLADLPFVNP